MIRTTYLKIARPEFAAQADGRYHANMAIYRMHELDQCISLYNEVGEAYYWNLYRIGWTGRDWKEHIARPDIEIFTIRQHSEVIGYLELRKEAGSVEIINFGLRPSNVGTGLGKPALQTALHYAFSSGVDEVWLHTCSLDHPAALKNYYACGFQMIEEKTENFLPLDPKPLDRWARSESPVAIGQS